MYDHIMNYGVKKEPFENFESREPYGINFITNTIPPLLSTNNLFNGCHFTKQFTLCLASQAQSN